MKRLEPGVYVDDEGALHLVLPEMLDAAGYADTPENRATLIDVAQAMFAEQGIPVEVDE